MKGSIKDLLNIKGVEGYIIATGKNIRIKVPSKHQLQDGKKHIRDLYKEVMKDEERPSNIIEIYLEDALFTIFISESTMMIVLSQKETNPAVLRMTGKLVIAGIAKVKHK